MKAPRIDESKLRYAHQEVCEMAESLYGTSRRWKKALVVAERIICEPGHIYVGTGAHLERIDPMIATYIAEGNQWDLLDPMIAYGYNAVSKSGWEAWGDAQG